MRSDKTSKFSRALSTKRTQLIAASVHAVEDEAESNGNLLEFVNG